MKFKSALIAILALIAASLAPLGAQADTRVTLTQEANAALIGTPVKFNPAIQSSTADYSSYDWSEFKYEIYARDKGEVKASATVQQISGSACAGVTGATAGGWTACTYEIGSSRTVLKASASLHTNAQYATLTLTANGHSNKTFEVRAWLDRNSNNQRDAYEPSSIKYFLNTYDPETAKHFIRWDVDPISAVDSRVVAWMNSGVAMVDRTKLSVKVTKCDVRGCTELEPAGVWNFHPQLNQYEFVSSLTYEWWLGARVDLYYAKSISNKVLLGSQTYDYTKRDYVSASTELDTKGAAFLAENKEFEPNAYPRQRLTALETATESFDYKLTLKDLNGQPAKGKVVDLIFDTKDMSEILDFRVEGARVSSIKRDLIYVSRKTDDLGQIVVSVSNLTPQTSDRLEIDFILEGFRSSELPGGATEEVIEWGFDRSRGIVLEAKPRTDTNVQLDLRATVTNAGGSFVVGETILTHVEFPLVITNSTNMTSATGQQLFSLGLNTRAFGQGTSKLTLQIPSKSGLVTETYTIPWDATKREILLADSETLESIAAGYSTAISHLKTVATLTVNDIAFDGVFDFYLNGVKVGSHKSGSLDGFFLFSEYPGPKTSFSQKAPLSKGLNTLRIVRSNFDTYSKYEQTVETRTIRIK